MGRVSWWCWSLPACWSCEVYVGGRCCCSTGSRSTRWLSCVGPGTVQHLCPWGPTQSPPGKYLGSVWIYTAAVGPSAWSSTWPCRGGGCWGGWPGSPSPTRRLSRRTWLWWRPWRGRPQCRGWSGRANQCNQWGRNQWRSLWEFPPGKHTTCWPGLSEREQLSIEKVDKVSCKSYQDGKTSQYRTEKELVLDVLFRPGVAPGHHQSLVQVHILVVIGLQDKLSLHNTESVITDMISLVSCHHKPARRTQRPRVVPWCSCKRGSCRCRGSPPEPNRDGSHSPWWLTPATVCLQWLLAHKLFSSNRNGILSSPSRKTSFSTASDILAEPQVVLDREFVLREILI